jgi:hypothetical protein
MNKDDIVIVGKKRKNSIWMRKIRKGKKVKILHVTKMEDTEEPAYVVALLEDTEKKDFDPEMDYFLAYEDELIKQ